MEESEVNPSWKEYRYLLGGAKWITLRLYGAFDETAIRDLLSKLEADLIGETQ